MFDVEVTPDGDGSTPFVVSVTSRLILMWEKQFPGRALNQLGGDKLSMGSLFELAFLGAKKEGDWDGNYSDFISSHDVAQVGDDEETDDTGEVDPTPETP